MGRVFGFIVLSVLTISLIGLAGPGAAQGPGVCQLRVALMAPNGPATPTELPATYTATLDVEVSSSASGMPCPGDTETVVKLTTTAPDGIEMSLEPAEKTIDWAAWYQAAPERGTDRDLPNWTVELTAEVPASYMGQDAHRVTIDGTAESDGPPTQAMLVPTQLTLEFPDAQEDRTTGADGRPIETSSSAGSNGSTPSSAGSTSDETGNATPGLVAPLVLSAIAVSAVVRRR